MKTVNKGTLKKPEELAAKRYKQLEELTDMGYNVDPELLGNLILKMATEIVSDPQKIKQLQQDPAAIFPIVQQDPKIRLSNLIYDEIAPAVGGFPSLMLLREVWRNTPESTPYIIFKTRCPKGIKNKAQFYAAVDWLSDPNSDHYWLMKIPQPVKRHEKTNPKSPNYVLSEKKHKWEVNVDKIEKKWGIKCYELFGEKEWAKK